MLAYRLTLTCLCLATVMSFSQVMAQSETEIKIAEQSVARGESYFDQGLFEKAIAEFKVAISLDPQNGWAYENLGAACMHLGRYEEAIAAFEQAIIFFPQNPELYVAMGDAYRGLEQYDSAVIVYGLAIDEYEYQVYALVDSSHYDAEYALAYNNLGIAYFILGSTNAAHAAYLEAINIYPAYATAYYNLAAIYRSLGNHTAAVAALEDAISIDPGYAKAYAVLGIDYVKLGRFQEAIAALEHYLLLTPGDPDGDHATVNGVIQQLQGKL